MGSRTVLSLCLLSGCAADPAYPVGPYGSSVGDTVENLQLYDLSGRAFTLDEIHQSEAEVVLLYLAATWCFTCGPEIEWLNEEARARPMFDAYVIVLQNTDFEPATPADGETFRREYDPQIAVLVDQEQRLAPFLLSDAIPLNIVLRTDQITRGDHSQVLERLLSWRLSAPAAGGRHRLL